MKKQLSTPTETIQQKEKEKPSSTRPYTSIPQEIREVDRAAEEKKIEETSVSEVSLYPWPRYVTRKTAMQILEKHGVLVDVVVVPTEEMAKELNEKDPR